jgi:predicted nuclease of predicted toxin-antitoxin system
LVLDLARREGRILIANDKDFGELVVRERRPHAGVILFRFALDSTAQAKIGALTEFLIANPGPLSKLVILSPQSSRLR